MSCGYFESSSSSDSDDKNETNNNISGRYTDTAPESTNSSLRSLTEPLLANNKNESGRESLFDVDLNSMESGGDDGSGGSVDEDILEILSVSSKLSDNVIITIPSNDKEGSTSTVEIDNTTSTSNSLEIKDDEDAEKVQDGVADDVVVQQQLDDDDKIKNEEVEINNLKDEKEVDNNLKNEEQSNSDVEDKDEL